MSYSFNEGTLKIKKSDKPTKSKGCVTFETEEELKKFLKEYIAKKSSEADEHIKALTKISAGIERLRKEIKSLPRGSDA